MLLALPAGASAKPHVTPKHAAPKSQASAGERLAADMCAQERAQLGNRAFRRKYGLEHSKRACVRVTRQLISAAGRVATGACRDELAAFGPEDFLDEYGADETSTVDAAMAECVAEEIDLILHPDQEIEDE